MNPAEDSANAPILHLPFVVLHERLMALLRSLDAEDWHRPTASVGRNVKDIAAHLLDTAARRLAIERDGYFPPTPPPSLVNDRDLVAFINTMNAAGEVGTKRWSPRLLIEVLDFVGRELILHLDSLDPFEPAIFAVAWAGERESARWFDVAREYTERWHHHEQIHEATGQPSTIQTRELYHPCLDAFLRGLPHALCDTSALSGTIVEVVIDGDAGGRWFAQNAENRWWLVESAASPAARVAIEQNEAWKLFTKRVTLDEALARFPSLHLEGNRQLAAAVVGLVAVMI